MKRLTQQEYLKMCEGAKVLEADPYGPKVYLLADGTILKLFRLKRLFSSALFFPYFRRFVRNARKLATIGVPVPTVLAVLRIPGIKRDAVRYRPLPGRTLRELSIEGLTPERKARLQDALNRLIIHLHENGVYFRSLHIGNIVVGDDDKLGLIDFSDIRFYPWKLGKYLRERNLQRMLGLPVDAGWVDIETVIGGKRQ